MEGVDNTETDFFGATQLKGKKEWMRIPATKTVVEKGFHSNSSQTLRDIPQRNYRICILGDVQTQLEQGPD